MACTTPRYVEERVRRHVILGVVQTAEGLSLYHKAHDGNIAEITTLNPTIERLFDFPVIRVIAVTDRDLLSTDNLTELQAIKLPSADGLEFILVVSNRRHANFAEPLAPFPAANAQQKVLGEVKSNALRLIIANDPHVATEAGAKGAPLNRWSKKGLN